MQDVGVRQRDDELIPIRRLRYDFFIVWGNGLDQLDSILGLLRAEQSLEILRIEKRRIRNMRRFVFGLYACDSVPVAHLRAKLKYLDTVVPEIAAIFVRNLVPEEGPAGVGLFRKTQCQNINRIKWHVRELFNPRVDGVRSEEHIIHASDSEEQVDYCLRLLGYEEGIGYLATDASGLPFAKPCHIRHPSAYTFRVLPVCNIMARILVGPTNQASHVVVPIQKTPHFGALPDDGDVYLDYYNRYRFTVLRDNHSWQRLRRMSQLSETEMMGFDPILISRHGSSYVILDGVHRAAVCAFRGIYSIKCVELEWA